MSMDGALLAKLFHQGVRVTFSLSFSLCSKISLNTVFTLFSCQNPEKVKEEKLKKLMLIWVPFKYLRVHSNEAFTSSLSHLWTVFIQSVTSQATWKL